MALAEYRKSDSWKAAIELGPKLISLAEELPAAEEMGLSFRLKKIMVELPAAAAHDLLRGSDTRQMVALRLVAALELIDRVYPALDTAETRTAAENLADQYLGELRPASAPAPAPHDLEVEPAEPMPEPTSVPVVPEPPAAPEPPVAPEVPVTEHELSPEPTDEPAHAPVQVNVQPSDQG